MYIDWYTDFKATCNRKQLDKTGKPLGIDHGDRSRLNREIGTL